MSGQRLEPDREAEIRAWVEREYDAALYPNDRFALMHDLLAELDAVRADLAAAEKACCEDSRRNAVAAQSQYVRAEKAEASLALVEGQAHRATEDVLALRRIATAAKELVAWDERWPKGRIYDGSKFKTVEGELDEVVASVRAAIAGWGDATRGAEDER